jgi:hypothetical protein
VCLSVLRRETCWLTTMDLRPCAPRRRSKLPCSQPRRRRLRHLLSFQRLHLQGGYRRARLLCHGHQFLPPPTRAIPLIGRKIPFSTMWAHGTTHPCPSTCTFLLSTRSSPMSFTGSSTGHHASVDFILTTRVRGFGALYPLRRSTKT